MTIRPIALVSAVTDDVRTTPQTATETKGGEPRSGRHSRGRATEVEGTNPVDWPGPGVIDLAVHDLPHASSTLEWWYMNTHVVTTEGRHLSLFAAFFRQAKRRNNDTGAFDYAHSVTWAILDVERKKYVHVSGVDPSAPEEGLKRLRRGFGSKIRD